MDFSDISLLIIAGGKSSRMKQDKRLIEVGNISLLESILIKASNEKFDAIFLCVEERLIFIEELSKKYSAKILVDKTQGAGPISGLISGLNNIKTQWALAVSCDMPFFDFTKFKPFLNELNDEIKILMSKKQPMAAFYHKSLADDFYKLLISRQRKLQLLIDKVPHKIINLPNKIIFFNVNTPADLRIAQGRAANINRKIPIISIIASKSGTGKTTFIERMIPKLTELGIRVGVIKSDSHSFNLDVEGKDSYKFQQAGANAVAVVSPNGYFIVQKTSERADFSKIADMINVDLILTESRTHGTQPAISLYRGMSEPLITSDVVALFTNTKFDDIDDIAQFDLDDIEQAINLILFLQGGDYGTYTF